MALVLHTILPVAISMALGVLLGELGFFDRIATAALVRCSVRIVVPGDPPPDDWYAARATVRP
jgi:predicted permease